MALLSPLGIFLPLWFKAGDAWGEWSADTLKELLGYVPEGLEKYAELWKAPLPDYSFNGESSPLALQSFAYIVSGVLGILFVGMAVFLIARFLSRHGK
ncbi:MAG: PDGLE domain-containing protein [Nitrospirales bacterium]|nr:PDGLE domain-containing protein [Nitrospirales bacterium]